VHGIGNGTDTRAPWALAIYGISVALVVVLLALRLRPRGIARPANLIRPAVGGLALVALVAAGVWTYAGPMQPGWNAVANNGHGSGSATAATSATAPSAVAKAPQPAPLAAQAFTADLAGSLQQSADGGTLLIDANIAGTPGGRFQLQAPATIDGGPSGTFKMRTAAGTTCVGKVATLRRGQVGVTCTDQAGGTWTIAIQLELAQDGTIIGRMSGQPGKGAAAG